MKNLIKPLGFVIFLSLSSAVCVESDSSGSKYSESVIEQTTEGVFEIEQGTIEYEMSGMSSGTEKLQWISFGEKQYKESITKIEFAGIVQEQENYNIIIGDDHYSIKPDEMTANHMGDEFFGDMTGAQKKQFGKDLIEQWGGRKVGSEKILGKDCEIWEIEQMKSKVWIWRGLSLKSETNMMGIEQTLVATRIDVNSKVSEANFDISKYKVTTVKLPTGYGK